ncbi:uncharacterized protein DS421_3g61400 [Arachis hypogaea]|nr:uncharacterized protein DS421_3g61400 [Arachis hypogaea]
MDAEEEELDANSDSTNNSTNLQKVSTILDPDFQIHIQTTLHQRYLLPKTSSIDLSTEATRISILQADFLIQGPAYLYAGTQPLDTDDRPWQGINPFEDEEAADLTTGSGAEDGASVKGEQMLETSWVDGVAAATSTRDPRRCGGGFQRVSPILARPAPLLAAVFPWDRKDATRTAGDSSTTANCVLYGAAQKTSEQREDRVVVVWLDARTVAIVAGEEGGGGGFRHWDGRKWRPTCAVEGWPRDGRSGGVGGSPGSSGTQGREGRRCWEGEGVWGKGVGSSEAHYGKKMDTLLVLGPMWKIAVQLNQFQRIASYILFLF